MIEIDELMSDAADRIEALEAKAAAAATLYEALKEYLATVKAVFEIDPETKRNWAELDPRKSDECLRRFQRLDAAGKQARAAIAKAEGEV